MTTPSSAGQGRPARWLAGMFLALTAGLAAAGPADPAIATGTGPSGVAGIGPSGVAGAGSAGVAGAGPTGVAGAGPAGVVADGSAPSAPGAPTVRSLLPTGFVLVWASSTDDVAVTGYRVQTVPMGCGLLPPLQWSSATNQLTVTDLLPGQTVTLQVLALDAAGHVSAPSAATRITVPGVRDTTPPTAPGTPVATRLTDRSVTLTWAPATDDTKVATYPVAELAVLGGVRCGASQTTSITLGWLNPGTTYVFVVTAVDWFGNESPRSAPVTVTTPPVSTADATPSVSTADAIPSVSTADATPSVSTADATPSSALGTPTLTGATAPRQR